MRRQLEAKESICYLLFVPTSITTSCIVMRLTIFLWEYRQSIKIGIDTGKAWVSLGWLNQSHLCWATQKPAITGASMEAEEDELLRHFIHWSLEVAGQLVLSHHENGEPSGTRRRAVLLTSMYTSPKYDSPWQIILGLLQSWTLKFQPQDLRVLLYLEMGPLKK